MVVLDISVVNVALPSIQQALHIDRVDLQWIVNAYALTFAGFLLFGGRLADIYGQKRILITGLSVFTLASLAGGLATSARLLITARACQGLAAAVLAPVTLTIITTNFPEGSQRTRAVATWAAVSSAGGAVGNILGGLLTQYLSWRWVLLINVPIGSLALLLAIRFLIADKNRPAHRSVDLLGAMLATIGLAGLTYSITHFNQAGWDSPTTIALMTLSIIALVAFVIYEARIATAPLLPLRLFRVRSISAGNLVMLLAGACFMPMWYFLSLFMQNVLDYSALKTGLAFLPHTALIVAGARTAPWIMNHIDGRRLILIAALIAASGFLLQSRATPESDYLVGILAPGIAISLGSGLLNTPLSTAVVSGVADEDAGAASGLMNTTKQVGGAAGLAALVAISTTELGTPAALAGSYSRAFLAIAVILIATAALTFVLPATSDAVS